jgi:hypothetical protein
MRPELALAASIWLDRQQPGTGWLTARDGDIELGLDVYYPTGADGFLSDWVHSSGVS